MERLTHYFHFRRGLFALIALALPLLAMADQVVVADANGNKLTYTFDEADGPATFYGVNQYAEDGANKGRIIIADNVTDGNGNSHEVKYIAGSLRNRSNLVSVTFGANIVAVGGADGESGDAFYNCDKLESVTLNSKLEILGNYAFQSCDILQNINLDEATALKHIKYKAFENCELLWSVTLPKSLAVIGEQAFGNIDSLRTVTIPSGSQLDSIGRYAFAYCYKLQSINLEAATQLKHLLYRAFYDCYDLQSVTIPASIEDFDEDNGADQFAYCRKIETITFLAANVPNNFYRGGSDAKLHTINIGSSVKRIGNRAFSNNYYLRNLNIDANVSDLEIGEYAFTECDRLSSVTLPKGVVKLGDGAFRSCDSLATFFFDEESPITEIPAECFSYCSAALEKLDLPNSVTTVGNSAFYYCRQLSEVNFGTSLTTFSDYYVFYYCEKLQKITLPGVNYPFTGDMWLPNEVVLYVNSGLVDEYRSNEFTSRFRVIPLGVQDTFAVTTSEGGQLQSQIPDDWAQYAQIVTITGPINGTDINYLHSSFPNIRVLNLKNARIVAGGDQYNQWDVEYNGVATIAPWYGPWDTEDDVVGYAMFYNMPSLESLTLPDGTTKIGEYAMAQDRHANFRLAEVVIPSTVTEIGAYAFYYAGIKEVTVPNGVTRIEDYTFWHCQKLQKATLPDGITYLGGSAFSEDYELVDVNVPASVETIGDYAFYNNNKRNTPVVIPNTCTTIGPRAFCYNYVMPSITFGNSIESIGYEAFRDCRLIEAAVLPNTLTSLGEGAFYNCDSLRTFTFPQNIKEVPYNVLHYCDALTSVTLADGTTSIAEEAFADCPRLSSINIAEQTSLTYTGNYVFDDTGFKTITLPNSITEMGYCAFQNCHQLESINVPTGIDYVPYDFCENCENLKSVQMHDGIRTIRHDAFYGCKSLKDIQLNDQITTIEYNAFRLCDSMKLDKLPSALTYIGDHAFYRTKAINGKLTIPEGVTQIEGGAFSESGLTGVVLPEGITKWGNDIFNGCDSLKSVRLPNDMKRINNYMFQYCKSLESITLPDSLTEIGYGAFNESGLTSIILPDSIQRVESYSFSRTKLETFRVPDGFTYDLGSYALYNCKELRSVYLGRNQDYTQISSFTCLYGCDSLKLLRLYAGTPPQCDTWYMGYRTRCVLEVPEDQVELYKEADGWKDFKEIRGFFMGDVLNEFDYAVLKALYNRLGGANWKTKWDLENDHHSSGKWNGVATEKIGGSSSNVYAITSIDLNGQGLVGELPDSLFMLRRLQTLNLSNNQLAGNLGELLVNRDIVTNTLTDVNLKGNYLTGDLYKFLERVPNVEKVDVSYNRLTAFSQVFPNDKLTDRNLSRGYQFIDFKTKEVVVPAELESEAIVDLTPGIPGAIERNTMQSYRHDYGDFAYNPNELYRIYSNGRGDLSSSGWELYKNSEGLWGLYAGSSNYVLTAPKGQPTAYTRGEPWWSYLTVILRFDWQDGDVNADQTVDVTDLQSVVYYALNDYKVDGQLFNYTAADVNADKAINVSDVVGSVDYILNYVQPTTGARASGYSDYSESFANRLTLTSDGLMLHNADEVAALQFTVTGVTQGQLHIGDDVRGLFTVAMRQTENGVRVVVYSADGRMLAAGSHQLLGMLPAGADVTEACLSDGKARRVGVSIEGTTTGVPSFATQQLAGQEVYDLNGRLLNTPWSELPQGVYVIRVNGKQYKVKK